MIKHLLAALALLPQQLHAEAAYVWENALTLESIHNFSGGLKKRLRRACKLRCHAQHRYSRSGLVG